MKQIAFIYFNKSYTIYHSISVAIELCKTKEFKVDLLCYHKNYDAIKNIVNSFEIENLNVIRLSPHWSFNLPHKYELIGKLLLRSICLRNKRRLNSYDAFVCTLYSDLHIKKYLDTSKLRKFIFTNHGISNRSYSYDEKIKSFDLFFILGKHEENERTRLGQLTYENYIITGFLKPDSIVSHEKINLFNNNFRTILYNPHWESRFTSYFRYIEHVVDYAIEHNEINLIIDPHTILLDKNSRIRKQLKQYAEHPNIHVDYGSELSNNMSYLRLADLYIGDLSSQALEFIYLSERPCLFLDAHDLSHSSIDVPLSWSLGSIVSSPEKLSYAISQTQKLHNTTYRDLQKTHNETTFIRSEMSPSVIASNGIITLLSKE